MTHAIGLPRRPPSSLELVCDVLPMPSEEALRLASEVEVTAARANAETERANAEAERANRLAAELEALRSRR
jgi:hypothetical protein